MTVNVEIFIYIYIWKLNPTLLELDLWTEKSLFFPRCDLNIDTLRHQSLSLMSSALDHSVTSAIYIYTCIKRLSMNVNLYFSYHLTLYSIFITKLDFTLWAISIDWYKYQHCVGIAVFKIICFFIYLYWYFASFLFPNNILPSFSNICCSYSDIFSFCFSFVLCRFCNSSEKKYWQRYLKTY